MMVVKIGVARFGVGNFGDFHRCVSCSRRTLGQYWRILRRNINKLLTMGFGAPLAGHFRPGGYGQPTGTSSSLKGGNYRTRELVGN